MSKYSSYILFLLISVFVVILAVNDFGPINNMQRSINDFLCRVTASDDVRPNVVIVNVDTRSQNSYGQWPWHYDLVGDLVAAVGSGQPRAIVVDAELYDNTQEDSAGYTHVLADQLAWVNNAVLPYDIALAAYRGTKTNNPKYLFNHSLTVEDGFSGNHDNLGLAVRKVFLPAEKLLASTPRLGFDYTQPDDDQVLRHQPMVMYYDGYYYPSLPLLAAAAYLNLPSDNIKVNDKNEIELGVQRRIPINDRGEYFVSFPKSTPVAQYSADDVLGTSFDFTRFKDQLIFIGAADAGQTDQFTTAIGPNIPELWVKATVAENIINNRFLKVQDHAGSTDLIILFILGAIGAFMLPRIPLLYRAIVVAGSLVVLANVNFFMVSSFNTLPQTIYIGLQLVLFLAASPLLDSSMLAGQTLKPKIEKSKHLKPASKERSKVDESLAMAAAPVREIRAKSNDPANQKTTALEFPEALPNPNYYEHENRDIDGGGTFDETGKELHSGAMGEALPLPSADEELEIEPAGDGGFDIIGPSKQSSQESQLFTEPFAGSPASTAGSVSAGISSGSSSGGIGQDSSRVAGLDTPELKSLGRYQVTAVLGKGAMGKVYKGIDPAINRNVALKTIRLDFVNDPAEYEELKERLFREAQAAGKLSHPNIVTIYDVGSEGQLQYIAMEYLEGQTLETLIKKKAKLNYRIIAQMITQICSALEYAHERGIVHRDIKPANIMVLSDYQVKVMDFGIARIDSNGMTKTGIAMGTPNYISPEQLKGVPIDRRADLFSLGVMMYEMLLGRRPFKGENITSLIYAILHSEPEKPSMVNPQTPLLFDHIIMRALKKVPAERYQKASEIASDMHDFVESFVTR